MQGKQSSEHNDGEHRKPDRARDDELSPADAKVLDTLRTEARKAGATLATGGKGGLPPQTVLDVMRRDRFKCKGCGNNKSLSVHHKGHLDNPSKAMERLYGNLAHDDPKGLVTMCMECHDNVHEADRERGEE